MIKVVAKQRLLVKVIVINVDATMVMIALSRAALTGNGNEWIYLRRVKGRYQPLHACRKGGIRKNN